MIWSLEVVELGQYNLSNDCPYTPTMSGMEVMPSIYTHQGDYYAHDPRMSSITGLQQILPLLGKLSMRGSWSQSCTS